VLIPESLRAAAARWNFTDWLDRLEGLVASCVERWSLQLQGPYPEGANAWVAPVIRPDGSDAVLKVSHRHAEAEYEAEGLRVWDGRGAVRLFDHFTTDDTAVLLLERCVPGATLRTQATEPEQDEVIAEMLKQLWIAPPSGCEIPPLSKLSAIWSNDIGPGVDEALAREARSVFAELSTDGNDRVLLCTDLHAGNVLAATRQPWLMIDPKPFVGDRAFDPVQHLLNALDRLASDPSGVTERMAALADVDVSRLRHWVFARCVSELGGPDIADQDALEHVARRLAP